MSNSQMAPARVPYSRCCFRYTRISRTYDRKISLSGIGTRPKCLPIRARSTDVLPLELHTWMYPRRKRAETDQSSTLPTYGAWSRAKGPAERSRQKETAHGARESFNTREITRNSGASGDKDAGIQFTKRNKVRRARGGRGRGAQWI